MSIPIKTTNEMLADFRGSAFPDRRQLAADFDALALQLTEESRRHLEQTLEWDAQHSKQHAMNISLHEQLANRTAELVAVQGRLAAWENLNNGPATDTPEANRRIVKLQAQLAEALEELDKRVFCKGSSKGFKHIEYCDLCHYSREWIARHGHGERCLLRAADSADAARAEGAPEEGG